MNAFSGLARTVCSCRFDRLPNPSELSVPKRHPNLKYLRGRGEIACPRRYQYRESLVFFIIKAGLRNPRVIDVSEFAVRLAQISEAFRNALTAENPVILDRENSAQNLCTNRPVVPERDPAQVVLQAFVYMDTEH